MRPLPILILSDGRPGHYHLAEGVAAAIGRRRPVAVTRIELRRRRWIPGRALTGLAGAGMSGGAILRAGYGLDAQRLPESRLVISAGGNTIAANIAAARHLKAVNIFCGTLRRAAPEDVSLVVSSYARHATLPRHLVALKPNGIDPDQLGARGTAIWRADAGAPKLAGLLVGGDSGYFRYSGEDWSRLVAFLSESWRAAGTRWVVSTSPRSPDGVGDRLAALAREPDGPIAEFIDFRTAGAGTLPRLFSAVDAILCTEDSSTMISEAVCARLPVVGVAPRQHDFKDEEREYRAFMQAQGWCRFLPLPQLTPSAFQAALAEVRPLTENHLDRLAAQLAERLPQLFDETSGP